MPASFIYSQRSTYFDMQDVEPDQRYAKMRHPVPAFLGDDFLTPRYNAPRTHKWYSKPKNSKPKHKEYR